ncbi:MAG: hypothetical protein ACR5KX_00665 [Wolbachia sp.]
MELFATGMVAVELIPIMIAVAAVTIAALAVGGTTYMLSKPLLTAILVST